jgi:hypothetical protein
MAPRRMTKRSSYLPRYQHGRPGLGPPVASRRYVGVRHIATTHERLRRLIASRVRAWYGDERSAKPSLSSSVENSGQDSPPTTSPPLYAAKPGPSACCPRHMHGDMTANYYYRKVYTVGSRLQSCSPRSGNDAHRLGSRLPWA